MRPSASEAPSKLWKPTPEARQRNRCSAAEETALRCLFHSVNEVPYCAMWRERRVVNGGKAPLAGLGVMSAAR